MIVISVFDDIEQVAAFDLTDQHEAPVVDHEHVDAGERVAWVCWPASEHDFTSSSFMLEVVPMLL